MTKNQRILFTISTPLLVALAILFTFDGIRKNVLAAPITRCVEPGGTSCNPGVCGGMCYATIQAAVDDASPNDEIRVAAGVYSGVHTRQGVTQVLFINKTVSIRGGYNSDLTVWNPDIYASKLDAQRFGRVVYITEGCSPTLEGLILTGGNGTGQTGDCSVETSPGGCGGGIMINDSSPVIVSNVITNNIAAMTTAAGETGYGGGIYLYMGDTTVISNNLIISNAASIVDSGNGGGVKMYYSPALVDSNQFIENKATTQEFVYSYGGGLSNMYTGASTIQNNLFHGNQANPLGGGDGAGLYQWWDFFGNSVNNNTFTGNYGEQAVYLAYPLADFASNQVLDNQTSIGVFQLKGSSYGNNRLANNIIARSGSNSVVFNTSGPFPINTTMNHNTLVGEGEGYGIYIQAADVNLNVMNTIIVSHSWGITNTFPAGSTVDASHNLFWDNDQDGIVGMNPVYGDPDFIDPTSDYHIGQYSAAIDAGLTTTLDDDIDGDPRPIGPGPDIGADEIRRQVYLPLILR